MLNEGKVYNNDTTYFFIKGNLNGENSEIIAQQDKLTFTFYDISKNGKIPINVECDVLNRINKMPTKTKFD